MTGANLEIMLALLLGILLAFVIVTMVVLLFAFIDWLAMKILPEPPAFSCRHCGYELDVRSRAGRCPECGGLQ